MAPLAAGARRETVGSFLSPLCTRVCSVPDPPDSRTPSSPRPRGSRRRRPRGARVERGKRPMVGSAGPGSRSAQIRSGEGGECSGGPSILGAVAGGPGHGRGPCPHWDVLGASGAWPGQGGGRPSPARHSPHRPRPQPTHPAEPGLPWSPGAGRSRVFQKVSPRTIRTCTPQTRWPPLHSFEGDRGHKSLRPLRKRSNLYKNPWLPNRWVNICWEFVPEE